MAVALARASFPAPRARDRKIAAVRRGEKVRGQAIRRLGAGDDATRLEARSWSRRRPRSGIRTRARSDVRWTTPRPARPAAAGIPSPRGNSRRNRAPSERSRIVGSLLRRRDATSRESLRSLSPARNPRASGIKSRASASSIGGAADLPGLPSPRRRFCWPSEARRTRGATGARVACSLQGRFPRASSETAREIVTVCTVRVGNHTFSAERAFFRTQKKCAPPPLFRPRKGATPSHKKEPLSSRSILLSRRVTVDALTP